MADEVRHDVAGFGGNDKILTPNLDRLSKESAVFRRAYCSQPVSPASRSTILTGLYPHRSGVLRHGIPLSKEVPTLVELMEKGDTVSAYMGLWVLGNEIDCQHGFDEWTSIEDGYRNAPGEADCEGRESSFAQYLREHDFLPDAFKRGLPFFSRYFSTRLPERFSKASFLAQRAARCIREKGDRPFVLYLSFLEPHPPTASVNDSLYPPESIALPPAFNAEPAADCSLRSRLNRKFYREQIADSHACSVAPLADESAWRNLIARYWGQISLVDKQIGVILDEVERCGLERETVIVFTSDHGDMMGDFRMLAKCVLFEPAVRVPLMIRIPGITDALEPVESPVSQVDLVPTLLDCLGQRISADLDGKSLLPVITGARVPGEDVVIEWQGPDGADKWCRPYHEGEERKRVVKIISAPVRTIITREGWKLSRSAAGEHELYDLRNDPMETKNLYFKGGEGKRIEELTGRLLAWQRKTGDEADLTGATSH